MVELNLYLIASSPQEISHMHRIVIAKVMTKATILKGTLDMTSGLE
jgi:hypothetical protein